MLVGIYASYIIFAVLFLKKHETTPKYVFYAWYLIF